LVSDTRVNTWNSPAGKKGGDYYKFLKEVGYATDPNYITKLKSIKI
jgi:flagellum-specific peptidoglycan hydrolase FlgJ